MSFLVDWLSGAQGAAQNTGGYYTTAANDIYNQYGPSATQQFLLDQNRALKPQFNDAASQLNATEAAQGIAHSGAGRANYGNLGAAQSSVLAGADAPLFSQGLGEAAGVYGAMPGAQAQSYDNAIQQFYQALSMAGSAAAGVPPQAGAAPSGAGYQDGGYYGSTENTGTGGSYAPYGGA